MNVWVVIFILIAVFSLGAYFDSPGWCLYHGSCSTALISALIVAGIVTFAIYSCVM